MLKWGLRRLTPENRRLVHLVKAREFWREDRLDLANTAMQSALRVGLPAGHWYDFQRMLEAEQGAREAGQFHRIAEQLMVEAAEDRWPGYWPTLCTLAEQAFQAVTDTLVVRWSKPVLLTLIPEDEWVQFLRSRYGYYAGRTEAHKVCLPPIAVRPPGTLLHAARHEITHAAVEELARGRAPLWLNEGLAVVLEGDRRRPPQPITMTLDQISACFESYESHSVHPQASLRYEAAGDFVGRLVEKHGWEAVRTLLVEIGGGKRPDRAFQAVYAQAPRQAEREWIQRQGMRRKG